ncbi:MAG: aminoglycoside phosphotransferase [Candidatus Berkelbacteria bacterium]|nr:aminoglycoside phosphotransferase [Candidatus Berkelbacteria bacterium]
MKVNNLDNLLDYEKAQILLLKYESECGLSPNFKIEKIERHLVLSPKTYALRYEIRDNNLTKIIRLNASSEETRIRAYHVMKLIKDDFSGPIYLIPKVYFYDPEYNLVVYENIEGGLLIDQLKDQNLEEKIALSGQWLRKLHLLKVDFEEPLPTHEVYFNFEALGKFYPDLAKQGDNILKELKGKLENEEQSLIHCDYQPTNIIIDNKKIFVIDFNDSQLGNPSLDVAKFLTQFKVMLTRFGDIKKYDNCKNIFLANYNLKYSQNNFKIYSAYYYLQILCSLASSFTSEWSDDSKEAKETLPIIYQYWQESNE